MSDERPFPPPEGVERPAGPPDDSSSRPGAAPPETGATEVSERDAGPAPGGVAGEGSTLRPGTEIAERSVGPRGAPPGGGVGAAGPVGALSDVDDFEEEPPTDSPEHYRRAERRVSLLFLASVAAAFVFVFSYIFMKIHTPSYGATLNYTLGISLAVCLFCLGAAFVVWAKTLLPKEYAVQDRHDGASSPEARAALQETFFAGADRMGIARFRLARRSMLLAMSVLPLPIVVLLRDLGPAPKTQLRHTAWRRGKRLVDVETLQPVKLGDLGIGAIRTVMPEGFEKLTEEETALSPTILIRLRPGQNHPLPGRANWAVGDHVAYSKVCTHAGCPTSLFESQTNNLLCPCHQSTFKVTEGCKVIFGPAARPLPQLPIALDAQGFFVAQGDYHQPVGPSFWERG